MLYEVLLRQSYFGRNVLNRWHYNGSGTPAAVSLSFALTSAFGGILPALSSDFINDTIMGELQDVQSEATVFVELQVKALYDVVDFYTVPYAPDISATQGGTPMSPFNAYAFQTNRVRTDIRRGNKRIVGVSEQYVGDAGIIEAGMPALLNNLADLMSDTLEYDDEGNTLSFQPAVLSFEKHAPDADHDEDWYAPYPTNAEQLDHTALGVSWTLKPYVTTQNSRKS